MVKPGFKPLPTRLAPMLATPGQLPPDDGEWAFEFKWDGMRSQIWIEDGRSRAVSRNGKDITSSFPELHSFGESLAAHQVLFDGELIVLSADGKPSFARLQHRINATSAPRVQQVATFHPVSLVIFDILHLDGSSMLELDYDRRRALLEEMHIEDPGWVITPSFTTEPGQRVFDAAVELGMEGVVAKRRSSSYRPGRRSGEWIKVKHLLHREAVIGGFTEGNGSRREEFGALLLGVPSPDRRLTFIGKVGTGFTDQVRTELAAELKRMVRTTSPFRGDLPVAVKKEAIWVNPKIVGEVQYREWTRDGYLRHPVWRGLRRDKRAQEVSFEP